MREGCLEQVALAKAGEFYKTFSSQNRFALSFRLINLKRVENRKKIAGYIEMLEKGETIHPEKPAGPSTRR